MNFNQFPGAGFQGGGPGQMAPQAQSQMLQQMPQQVPPQSQGFPAPGMNRPDNIGAQVSAMMQGGGGGPQGGLDIAALIRSLTGAGGGMGNAGGMGGGPPSGMPPQARNPQQMTTLPYMPPQGTRQPYMPPQAQMAPQASLGSPDWFRALMNSPQMANFGRRY
jgi:hypothetical protein